MVFHCGMEKGERTAMERRRIKGGDRSAFLLMIDQYRYGGGGGGLRSIRVPPRRTAAASTDPSNSSSPLPRQCQNSNSHQISVFPSPPSSPIAAASQERNLFVDKSKGKGEGDPNPNPNPNPNPIPNPNPNLPPPRPSPSPVAAASTRYPITPLQSNHGKPVLSIAAAGAAPGYPTAPSTIQLNQTKETLTGHKSVLSVPPIAPIAAEHNPFAEFLYKGKGKGEEDPRPNNDLSSPNPKPPNTASPTRYPTTSSPLPSSLVQQWRPYPKSYVVMVDGERRVISRFFPPPPNAIIIHEEEEIEIEIEVVMVPARNPSRKRKKMSVEMMVGEEGDQMMMMKKKERRIKQRSYLTAEEKRMDCYRRVVDGSSTWVPPASPYNLLQEKHFFDPWRVFVICILLNQTQAKQVRKVLDDLFLLCPNAEAATMVCEEELELLLKSLGLWRTRAVAIKRLSRQFLCSDWTHVTQLHGVGKYAADAYAIFCAGKPWEVVPQDHKLVDYWRFVLEKLVHAL